MPVHGQTVTISFIFSVGRCGWANGSETEVHCDGKPIPGQELVPALRSMLRPTDGTDPTVIAIGVASESGVARIERDRAENRSRNLARWISSNATGVDAWFLNMGKFSVRRLNNVEQRPVFMVAISGHRPGEITARLIKSAMKRALKQDQRIPNPEYYSQFDLFEPAIRLAN
jgi:hypothetical protein